MNSMPVLSATVWSLLRLVQHESEALKPWVGPCKSPSLLTDSMLCMMCW